jgi:WD40 repeat protein
LLSQNLAFISYAHEDRIWLDRVLTILKPHVRVGELEVWSDRRIEVGRHWYPELESALSRARVAVLLVSQHFAASDFVVERELPILTARADQGDLTLFCVPVSSCNPKALQLDRYQWLRAPERPLDLLSEPRIARELIGMAKKLVGMFDDPPTPSSDIPASAPRPPPLAARSTQAASLRRSGPLHWVPELPPHFIAPRSEADEIGTALVSPDATRVGVISARRAGLHGQGGIGKTVLASAVVRGDSVREAFTDGIFWLTLGQQPDLLALQKALLRVLSDTHLEIQSVNLGRLELIEKMRERCCLLVLDDVWQLDHAHALNVIGEHGRLLITTRDREVLYALGASVHTLDLLAPADALTLLANWSGQTATELPPEAAELAKECGYLPLALALIGAQARSGARWRDLLQALRDGDFAFLDYANASVFNSMQLGIKALSQTEADRYLELAIFPEDTAIPERVVLRLWRASELSEIHGRRLLRSLQNKALVQLSEGAECSVRLHDLQGDFLRLIAPDLRTFHARLLAAHSELLTEAASGSKRSWASLPTTETYLWQQLFHHLRGAGDIEGLLAVACDMSWLQAKISATGVSSLLGALAELKEVAPARHVHMVERVLRLEAGWLHQRPEALPELLFNRLRCEGLTGDDILRLVPGLRPALRLRRPVRLGRGRVFRGQQRRVQACVYSPDGTRILSATDDGALTEWDRTTGKQLQRFEGHALGLTACAYSEDGTRLLSAGQDQTIREWDRATGCELLRLVGHAAGVTACCYSPEGDRVLSASWDGTLREWDRATGVEMMRFLGHTRGVLACAYSADGERVLSGSCDASLREWDRHSGREVAQFLGHAGPVTGCVFAADGGHVLSASGDKTLREWQRVSRRELRRFEGHSDRVTACSYSRDGTRVLSSSWDGTVREWIRAEARELSAFREHSDLVTASVYAQDGFILSASHDKTMREWDPSAVVLGTPTARHTELVTACACSADGTRVLTGSYDHTLDEWDAESGESRRHFIGHSHRVTACAYDGEYILSASEDRTFRVWDPATGETTRQLQGQEFWVTPCAHVISITGDGGLREWDYTTGREARRFEGHTSAVTACAYSADAARVLSASNDWSMREWDGADGRVLRRFDGHTGVVTDCAYAPNGVRVLSSSGDRTLREWDRRTGEVIRIFGGHTEAVTACAYSPSGSHLLSASEDGTIRVWDSQSGECVGVVFGAAPFYCVAGARGLVVAGDALGNVWLLDCEWF